MCVYIVKLTVRPVSARFRVIAELGSLLTCTLCRNTCTRNTNTHGVESGGSVAQMLDINTLCTLPAGLHILEAPPPACMGAHAHTGMHLRARERVCWRVACDEWCVVFIYYKFGIASLKFTNVYLTWLVKYLLCHNTNTHCSGLTLKTFLF